MDRIKVFPAVILTLGLLLAVKGVDSLIGLENGLSQLLPSVEPAFAADEKKEPGKDQTKAGTADKGHKGHASHAEGEDPEAPPRPARPPLSTGVVSASELDLLESLGERRRTIDARVEEIEMKQRLLSATEGRIDEKIAELRDLEGKIQGLLGQRDQVEEEQIQSLVKVYENMKAKDAARIFAELDRDIMLDVASRMKEARIAAIMAKMDSRTAQELTVMLATRADVLNEAETLLEPPTQ